MNTVSSAASTSNIKLDLFTHTNALYLLIVLTVFAIYLICTYKNSKIVVALGNAVSSGYGHVALVILSICWATAVSVASNTLKEQWFESSPLGWQTTLVVLSMSLVVIGGLLHLFSQQRKEKERLASPPIIAAQTASTHINSLMVELHLCLADWEQLNIQLSENSQNIDEFIDIFESNLKKAKTGCMKAMADVAKNWHDSSEINIYYNANLLNIVSSHKLLNTFEKNRVSIDDGPYELNIEAIEQSPFFLFNDNWKAKLERCDYVMINEQSLSVSLPEQTNKEPHPPLCIPYSNESPADDPPKQPNLHGAPLARSLNRLVYLPDMFEGLDMVLEKLQKSPSHSPYLNEKFKSDLRRYYQFDSAGSIISIPLSRFDLSIPEEIEPEDDSIKWPRKLDDQCACILNVYVNKSSMFENRRMASSYATITEPICYILSILVSLRLELVCLKKDLAAESQVEKT
ncbi:hypothetical protein [Vibrio sp. Y58_MX_L22]|uniref:hypothetical protein n=1 Tax=Vibrio sp. Y58_MX_L22 TaxID=2957763 RepID=UPI0020A29E73|nr:hypothetical protein [Vibrio sp. Y58_MX_L22]ELI1598876.1 hypothetical protein [Vibrio alginolyticus]